MGRSTPEGACDAVSPAEVGGFPVGTRGSATIEGRFDCGYFCKLKFGRTTEFKGAAVCLVWFRLC